MKGNIEHSTFNSQLRSKKPLWINSSMPRGPFAARSARRGPDGDSRAAAASKIQMKRVAGLHDAGLKDELIGVGRIGSIGPGPDFVVATRQKIQRDFQFSRRPVGHRAYPPVRS